jgi:hypothetical protein
MASKKEKILDNIFIDHAHLFVSLETLKRLDKELKPDGNIQYEGKKDLPYDSIVYLLGQHMQYAKEESLLSLSS